MAFASHRRFARCPMQCVQIAITIKKNLLRSQVIDAQVERISSTPWFHGERRTSQRGPQRTRAGERLMALPGCGWEETLPDGSGF